jgi:hypothetical protein
MHKCDHRNAAPDGALLTVPADLGPAQASCLRPSVLAQRLAVRWRAMTGLEKLARVSLGWSYS